MTEPMAASADESAIDDVRRIREQSSRESGGDIRRHVEQTQTAFQGPQSQSRWPTISPPRVPSSDRSRRGRTWTTPGSPTRFFYLLSLGAAVSAT
jgi:hypothetical protein